MPEVANVKLIFGDKTLMAIFKKVFTQMLLIIKQWIYPLFSFTKKDNSKYLHGSYEEN